MMNILGKVCPCLRRRNHYERLLDQVNELRGDGGSEKQKKRITRTVKKIFKNLIGKRERKLTFYEF